MNIRETLSFDDVLLVPTYSEIESRLHTDVSTSVGGIPLKIPLITSAMDTITEWEMAVAIGKLGGMGIVHRFMTKEDQLIQLEKISCERNHIKSFIPIVAAVGVKDAEQERLDYLMANLGGEIDMISIDIANGHSSLMREMIQYVKNRYKNIPIMAGNVATAEGYEFLRQSGVNAVRTGIGGGSICKTRIQTCCGISTFESLLLINKVKNTDCSVIADGGIRYPKDLVASLAAGADAVMCGNIFSGTLETPGGMITNADGTKSKMYRGMASKSIQEDRRGGLKQGTCDEGVTTFVPLKGSISEIVDEFVGGLRSGMAYQNSRTISELQENPQWIRVTNAGLNESHAFGTKK